ncbi:CHAT domain-containing protein [Crucibulum laeve]|uniref:CHAT domain-containing protein n=1 Tax=Crucibulum laeve TaxID=68775 RepID=A0A5C3LN30_9AGAR|nr:CHAT domain-containing protein [Crucibulum laeve]
MTSTTWKQLLGTEWFANTKSMTFLIVATEANGSTRPVGMIQLPRADIILELDSNNGEELIRTFLLKDNAIMTVKFKFSLLSLSQENLLDASHKDSDISTSSTRSDGVEQAGLPSANSHDQDNITHMFHSQALHSFHEYKRRWDMALLKKAIVLFQMAVKGTPSNHPQMCTRMHDLGTAFFYLFERSRVAKDINMAVAMHQKAVELTLPDDATLPDFLYDLGKSLQRQFDCSGDAKDVALAVAILEKSVNLMSDHHENIFDVYNDLGTCLRHLFQCTGKMDNIDAAILAQRTATNLASNNSNDLPTILNNLGISLRYRFQHTGSAQDIDEAIAVQQNAVDISRTHLSNTRVANILNSLGSSYRWRFTTMGNTTDIDSAILVQDECVQLTPETDRDLPMRLNNLGISLRHRFERIGDTVDIKKTISVQQRALTLVSTNHMDRAAILNSLGTSFRNYFDHTGDINYIEEAIGFQQQSVLATPDGHIHIPIWLNNLASSLLQRFERTGNVQDIDDAIAAQEKSVHLIPQGHAYTQTLLNNLGTSLQHRFQQSADVKDNEEAINAFNKALDRLPEGNPLITRLLNNLGNSYRYLFQCTGDIESINEAIACHSKAVETIPDDHALKMNSLSNLGKSYQYRFTRNKNIDDMDTAISLFKKALELTPDDHADVVHHLHQLATAYENRFAYSQEFSDIIDAVMYYHAAAESSTGPPSLRFECAQQWASLSWKIPQLQSLTLRAYSVAFELLPQVIWLGETVASRHTKLKSISNLASSAAAVAISLGNYDAALQWLESGRCIVWAQLNNLRTPLDDLREVDPQLADQLLHVSKDLEKAGMREQKMASLDNMVEKISFQTEVQAHLKLASLWDSLLEKVRGIHGFDNFLQPMQVSKMLSLAPQAGPVVVINAHASRCDALALIPGAEDVVCIPLPQLPYKKASELQELMSSHLLSGGIRSREVRGGRPAISKTSGLRDILSDLWKRIVEPVLEGLAFSRIWWCATGPLSFLPLHAAGIYGNKTNLPGKKISDFVISSYTPTVNSILDKDRDHKPQTRFTGILAISQPNTANLPPIPCTTKEGQYIEKAFSSSQLRVEFLEGSDATVERVSRAMELHSFVHFACHAYQDQENPTKSAFYLADGTLALEDIINNSLPNANLAFLSACQTATGDKSLSEEAIHLAAGMLMAGYKSVIATMWPISDDIAVLVAERFYSRLLVGQNSELKVEESSVAKSFHYAVQTIREKLGDSEESYLSWVPYIHIGM